MFSLKFCIVKFKSKKEKQIDQSANHLKIKKNFVTKLSTKWVSNVLTYYLTFFITKMELLEEDR